MSETVSDRTTGFALMGLATLVYFSRPWSCGLVLSRYSRDDSASYAMFDYHGYLANSAWLLALLYAAPVLWLGSKLFLSSPFQLRILGRAKEAKNTLVSILVALAMGVPAYAQIAYMIVLPLSIAMPVWISSLTWLVVVEVGRTMAVRADVLDRNAVAVAIGLAIMVTVPKVVLIAFAASQL